MKRYLGMFWVLAFCCLTGCSAAPRAGWVNHQPAPYHGPPDQALAEKVKKTIQSNFKNNVSD